jgi:hypothetical protein
MGALNNREVTYTVSLSVELVRNGNKFGIFL